MESKPPPLICEKCHTRRLHPIRDKGHRWCKKCRTLEFAKVAGLPSDERRKLRAGYNYEKVAAMFQELLSFDFERREYPNSKCVYYAAKPIKPTKRKKS